MDDWRRQRELINARIEALREQGICYTCHDLETAEVFGQQPTIYEDDLFKVVLESFPRTRAHTIVIYKPHREDLSELSQAEVGPLFEMCHRVIQAIKASLGAEKVYLNTMCDGGLNHLHLQLFPRFVGEPTGSKRFVAPRGPLQDGDALTAAIRAAL